eukprot:Seg390.3 transcript_id=Seg390.3/GoldUCD/mRNA.D3Y31 product="hypothetical protein" protein_id=Seg390.3/GoldUCD/D3Y31
MLLKVFCWDNFDKNIDSSSGQGSIHNIPATAFQEETANTILQQNTVSILHSKRRSLCPVEKEELAVQAVNRKAKPLSLAGKFADQAALATKSDERMVTPKIPPAETSSVH